MKRKILSVAVAVMCVALSACSSNENNEVKDGNDSGVQAISNAAPSEVTSAILVEIPINSAIEKGIDDLSVYFTELDTATLESASYYMCASGAYPDEIAVFKFTSEELAEQGISAVQARLDKQISVYESYTPDEMYKLDGAVIEKSGSYVYYLVTSDNEKAKGIAEGFLG